MRRATKYIGVPKRQSAVAQIFLCEMFRGDCLEEAVAAAGECAGAGVSVGEL